ncbi:MAG: transglutaminase domain-containing protein [Clostridia bacterium]|nr:transglutaminase domain-containing protein [Clostridia bacterium]
MIHEPFHYEDIKLMSVELPDTLKSLRYAGRDREELEEIERLLSPDSFPKFDPVMEGRLKLERYFAWGLMNDYKTTEDEMIAIIAEKHPGFGADNLRDIINTGHADYLITSEGIRFQKDAGANILGGRCAKYLWEFDHPGELYDPKIGVNENIRIMKEKGFHAYNYTVNMWIRPDANHQREGRMIRAWLPFPCECEEQSDIRLLSVSHPNYYVSNADTRTVYAEFPYHKDEKFEITFSFTNTARYKKLDFDAAKNDVPPALKCYTEEYEPHILFTPYLKKLAAYLKGSETNHLKIARRFYDYVTNHVKYSFVREYRLFDNIPMYAAVNGRGDCGVMALLFVTLCRIAGIPAKWQSGNACYPNRVACHDWAKFYVEPWGWMHVDCSYGGSALRNGDLETWNWFFGNLDPFRFIACNAFQTEADPKKKYMRIEPYDNQVGELEYEDEWLTWNDVETYKGTVEAHRVE